MKTALVYPPLAGTVAPHLALPALTAYLRRDGKDVTQTDLNTIFNDWLFSSASLTRTRRDVEARVTRLRNGAGTNGQDAKRAHALDDLALLLGALEGRLDESRAALKRLDTYRFDPVTGRAGHAIHRSVLHVAETLIARELPFDRWSWLSAGEMVDEAVRNPHPVLSRFEEETVVPWLEREAPDLVGITVPFRQQLFFAVFLAAALKRRRPDLPVVVGGHVVTQLCSNPERMPPLFDVIDYIVMHDGEVALTNLIRALEAGTDPRGGENLVWRGDDGHVVISDNVASMRLAELPPPDFDGLNLDDYLNGEVIFPLEASRGCYWNKCTFCSYVRSPDGRYRQMPLQMAVDNLEAVARKHDVKAMMLVDEAVSSARATRLANEIRERGLECAWYFMARLDGGFTRESCEALAASGAYGIFYGLESGNREVLERMAKGVDLDVVRDVLDSVTATGLSAHLSLMVGFPGETHEQALDTLRVTTELVTDRPGFTANAHEFHLVKGSEMFEDPDRFGMTGKMGDDGRTLSISYQPITADDPDGSRRKSSWAEVNAGIRKVTHPEVFAQEESLMYFLSHGREEFLRLWKGSLRRHAERESGWNGNGDALRSTGEVLLLRRNGSTPAAEASSLCHIASGRRVGVPPVVADVFTLFETEPALTIDEIARRVPEGVDAAAVRGIVERLVQFGAVEVVRVRG